MLDISKPEGREALIRLVREADIFLTNTRLKALARARLDYESLRAENPRLIYASVTGYGSEGPDADKPGFDVAAYWSRSGVAGLTTPKGAEPFPIRTAMGDHVTSMATVSAILAAVVERSRTGVGRLVETSLLRTGIYSVASDMAIQLKFGRVASNRPRADAINPIANFFQTADGRWICLVPRQGNGEWVKLATLVGRPELADDPRFADAFSRSKNGAAAVAILDEAFGAMSFEAAAEALDAIDFVWSPVQAARDVATDPQARASGCFVIVPDGEGGEFEAPATPARFPGAEHGPRGPAPKMGEHTDVVLRELGYAAEEIAAMKAAGAAA